KYLIAKGDFISARKRRSPDPPDDSIVLTTWAANGFFGASPSRPEAGLIVEKFWTWLPSDSTRVRGGPDFRPVIGDGRLRRDRLDHRRIEPRHRDRISGGL